ncbi:RCC1 domain-containing protein [Kutzneria kofuensis]|uniref:Alpha-tubulin suppressor-like RCC1 family protein n=1 Tax=Kutzneria kofuensis TaxID=103725 RepID=A0A7W9KGK9_9PSEU|nr:hypothetical protein [Kutzneria kofuensis]MBB5892232.1 alpha-tubulin suppressor-like RCC1 family protein [Kutzneria kofuensis]
MALKRIAVLAALTTTAALAVPVVAQAATAQPPSGSQYTAIAPTRVYDSRGHGRIPARGFVPITLNGVVPSDATAVVFNLTGIAPDNATYLSVGPAEQDYEPSTSNVNLAQGEVRANLVTAAITPGQYPGVRIWAGPWAVDVVVDVEGYYAPGHGSKFTPVSPHRMLDTRDSAPVGPGGTVTLDLSSQVPAGATAATFNLTGTNVTGSTFVTAYQAGQPKPGASNLNLAPGRNTPNLVTVPVGPDRRVTLANAYYSVDLIADLAGYYSPDSAQSFYPMASIRVMDTRTRNGWESRIPFGANENLLFDLGKWLPPTAKSAVFNLTGTFGTENTFLTAYPENETRPASSILNLVPGQTSSNAAVVALSPETKMLVFNLAGSQDVVIDLAGYFAPSVPSCQQYCAHVFGDNTFGQAGDGTTSSQPRKPAGVYGLPAVKAIEGNRYDDGYTALAEDGTVWTWGADVVGETPVILDRDTPDVPRYVTAMPTQVPGLTDVKVIGDHVALKSDGTVWSWGSNRGYALGTGDLDTSLFSRSAVQVKGLKDIVAIAGHVALKADHSVWSWGSNFHNELGDGEHGGFDNCFDGTDWNASRPGCADPTAVQVSGMTDVVSISVHSAVKSDGSVWHWGFDDNTFVPVQVAGLTDASTVSGPYVLKKDSTVWQFDEYGRVASSRVGNLSGVRAISNRNFSTGYALMFDGAVYAWGNGNGGALGDGRLSEGDRETPALIAGVSGATYLGTGGAYVANS